MSLDETQLTESARQRRASVPADPSPAREPRRRRRKKGSKGRRLHIYTWVAMSWLYLPILAMILFGFNNTKGKFNYTWQGFTLDWYKQLFAIPDLTQALLNSMSIAVISTLVATSLGTGIGLAVGKYRFRGRAASDVLMFAAIATPEVVIGAALLSLFIVVDIPRGYLTIVIAHIMFCIAFVAVTVRARMLGFDHSLEEVSRDLGASAFTTFTRITLPLVFPAILAGGLLAFALSMDNYITTSFNAGQTLTFPLWVFGATRVGIPPQVNVMATLLFAVGVAAALATVFATRGSRSR